MFHAAGGLCGKAGGKRLLHRQAYFDADGWCACHNSDIWGATYRRFPDGDGDSSCYAVWFMSGAWILNQLYTHSLYQKDPAFDEKLKGMFAGALAFFHSSMTAHNGQPVTCPPSARKIHSRTTGSTAP